MGPSPVIILWHQAQLAENLGAVARAMRNFSLSQLRLIAPLCSPLDDKAIATAAGADHILHQAQIFATLKEATADLNWLYGTCATVRHIIKTYTPIHEAAPKIITQSLTSKTGILFGPERTGLDNESLSLCHEIIQIPVDKDFSSLNIAQACVVIGYELFKSKCLQNGKPLQSQFHYGETCPAPREQLDAFLADLESRLDKSDYWRVSSKKPLMWRNLQNIFTRLHLTQQDIQTLWGMISTLQNKK
jgi:tRNA/rRNA methyltransferase